MERKFYVKMEGKVTVKLKLDIENENVHEFDENDT